MTARAPWRAHRLLTGRLQALKLSITVWRDINGTDGTPFCTFMRVYGVKR